MSDKYHYSEPNIREKLKFILDRPFNDEFSKNFESISNKAIAFGLIAIGMSDERRLVKYVLNERWKDAYFFIEQHRIRSGPSITECVLDLIDERRIMQEGESFFAPDAMTAIVSLIEGIVFAKDLYNHTSETLARHLLDEMYEMLRNVNLLQ